MKKFLVIRRDNIGDLLCTTPLIRSLRLAFPDAEIDVLVNSYNRGVIKNNPDINQIFVYQKGKHINGVLKKLQAYYQKLRLIFQLRARHYDWAFLASPGKRTMSLAKQTGVAKLAGFYKDENDKKMLAYGVDIATCNGLHEVERVHRLINAVATEKNVPPMVLVPEESELNAVQKRLKRAGLTNSHDLIGLHISARKPSNRWAEEKYIELIKSLLSKGGCRVLLFWSPGSEDCTTHPGDDEMSQRIVNQIDDSRLIPVETKNLQQLIAAINFTKLFICSDGGAMHIAASLNKKIICFFGDSDSSQWYPWAKEYEVLKNKEKNVSLIEVETVLKYVEGESD